MLRFKAAFGRLFLFGLISITLISLHPSDAYSSEPAKPNECASQMTQRKRGVLSFLFRGKRKLITIGVPVLVSLGVLTDVALFQFAPGLHPIKDEYGSPMSLTLRGYEFFRDVQRGGENAYPILNREQMLELETDFGGESVLQSTQGDTDGVIRLDNTQDFRQIELLVAREAQRRLNAAFEQDNLSVDRGDAADAQTSQSESLGDEE